MSMKESSTREIETIKEFYAAINSDEISSLIQLCDPEIERVEPVEFPTSGTYRGHAEFKAHMQNGRSTWAEGTCQPEEFFISGTKIAVRIKINVRLKNETKWIRAEIGDGFKFRDGKVIEMHSFADYDRAVKWAQA